MPLTLSSTDAIRSISKTLAGRIGHHTYEMWFGDTTQLHIDGAHLEVAASSGFVADWIRHNYDGLLAELAQATLGEQATVGVRLAPDLFETATGPPPAPRPEPTAAPAAAPPRRAATLRRLEDFVVGASNRLAFMAARRLAAVGDDGGLVSPLFIHCDCGVGKTHLLQGIVHEAIRERRGGGARYLTAEQFTNEYINAVRANAVDAFRKRLRKLELLAIDDVHFLTNKVATQNELQHTIDAIALAGARVVFASDEHPRHLGFPQALASRFVAGMVAEIERPDRATRLVILGKLAASRGFDLSEPAAEAIASRCAGSVRELEGAANKLAALRLLTEGPADTTVGLLLVEQLFADGSWRPAVPVRFGTVIDEVCNRLVVNRAQLMGSGRHRRVVTARGLVAYLGRELTTLSYPEIAQTLGRKHHSTIHTAVRRVTRQLADQQRVDVGESGETMTLNELVDQLRHRILKASRNPQNGTAAARGGTAPEGRMRPAPVTRRPYPMRTAASRAPGPAAPG